VLDLTGGTTRTYVGDYTGSGEGTIRFGSGLLQVGAVGASFNFPGTLFQWSGGALSGPGTLTNNGTLTLSGSTAKSLNGVTLNNAGTVIWTGTGVVLGNYGAVFNNLVDGVFDVQGDATFRWGGFGAGVTIDNLGIFRKSAGTGTTVIGGGSNVTFSGGTVEVLTGTLNLSAADTTTSGGNFTVAEGAVLDLTGGTTRTYVGDYTGSGEGTIRLGSGTLNIGAVGASFNFPGTLFQWSGGTLGGPGTLTNNGTLTLSGSTAKSLNNVTLNNAGTVIWTGTGVVLGNTGAVFNNLVNGVFDAQDNATFRWGGFGAGLTIDNLGIFRKSAGTGTTVIGGGSNVTFTNAGTIESQAGVLNFTGGYTQSEGTTNLSGGNIAATGTVSIQGGTLSGSGTVTAAVVLSGQVNPGGVDSSGVLTIVGNYTQEASGVLTIELGGLTPGTQFDQLKVSGSATLNGTLDVSTIGGFTPGSGDSFQVLTYGSHTGEFETINGNYTPTYNPTNLTITAQ
jgi:hypothetical protein